MTAITRPGWADRPMFQLAAGLGRADSRWASAWWAMVAARGLLPAVFSVVTGVLVAAVQHHRPLAWPLTIVAIAFVALQVLAPLHTAVSANLGDRVAAWLYDRLTAACAGPHGLAHLENPDLAADLQVARDFDRGMTGPPLSISMDFIATGLIDMVAGVAQAAVLFALAWWAPLVLGAGWLSTHWLLRESGVWKDRNTDEVRLAQRHADYAYRLAVDPPAAKEVRVFGLSDWVLERFVERRRRLHELQYRATRMRERSVLASLAAVGVANAAVFGWLGWRATGGHLALGPLVVFTSAAAGAARIAFGGINWALDGASAPVAAVSRLERAMAAAPDVAGGPGDAAGTPAQSVRFRDVTFAYPQNPEHPVLRNFDLDIPAGTSVAVVGSNGAGKTTLAKLLCRFYDPQSGAIEVDGVDLRQLDVGSWRSRLTAVFQDFVRFELSLRENVAPAGGPDPIVEEALAQAGAGDLADLDTVLAKGYTGGTDLSGGQWQRVALARALAAVGAGAGLVILDEPTAQLDVRGEAEIFERILAATRNCTTILVSHRFSTVRHADQIVVVDGGAVVERGTHDQLMAAGGRYATMFSLQAERFAGESGEEEASLDALA